MPPTIFTAGYTGIKIEALEAWLKAHNALMLDIRFSPRSMNPVYSRKQLEARLGLGMGPGQYWPFSGLFGNRDYQTGGMRIADYPAGREILRAITVPAVLMLCGCKDATTCHRTVVANMLRADGFEVAGEWEPLPAPPPPPVIQQQPLF